MNKAADCTVAKLEILADKVYRRVKQSRQV